MKKADDIVKWMELFLTILGGILGIAFSISFILILYLGPFIILGWVLLRLFDKM